MSGKIYQYGNNALCKNTLGKNMKQLAMRLTMIFTTIFLFILGSATLNLKLSALDTNPVTEQTIKQIETGEESSYLLESDGSLWTWGSEWDGTLLYGGYYSRNYSPVKLMENVVSVSAENEHILAIKNDGSLWTWGRNSYGQLGDGTTTDRPIPVQVMDNVVSISAGRYHSLAIKNDGSLWAWGYNFSSQLGDGTTTNRPIPVKVMDNIISVSAGPNHSLAIKDDGSLWAWGYNFSSQLGDGTTTNQPIPVKVMDDIISVSAGSSHSLAIKSDGSLWAWGDNYFGDLGDGTTTDRTIPVKVMDNVVSISARASHSLAIKSDNSLWEWGHGYACDLCYQPTPTKVLDTVISVSSGVSHALALQSDGSLWAWGDNGRGQLGDGTTISKREPLVVSFKLPSILQSESSYAYRDTVSTKSIYLPIFKGAPRIYLTFSSDISAVFKIISEDIAGNFSIDTVNQIIASQAGSATVEVTNSTGNVVYNTFQVIAYSDKPQITTKLPYNGSTNSPVNIKISNSQSSYLNGQAFSGGLIFTEGEHTLTTSDIAGFIYTSTINIDYTLPAITINSYSFEPTNQNITVTASTNEGSLNTWAHTFTSNGSFDFIATDLAGNTTTQTVTISNIDKDPPVISGVSINGYFNTSRTITFTEGIVTLDGVNIQSGTIVSSEGKHSITATDNLGNSINYYFTLDFTKPVITIGDYTMSPTNQDIDVIASTNEGFLNTSFHTFTENGEFTFIASDLAGNETKETIIITNIDKEPPLITGVKNEEIYNNDRTITFTEGNVTLNGIDISSGVVVSDEGIYTLVAKDALGNSVTMIFTVDKTEPVVTIGEYLKTPTNQDITVTASTNEGTLNKTSHTFSENGSFTFSVTDAAGNTTTETVTITNIDKMAPVITIGDYLKTPTNQNIIVTASTNEGTLNATSHTFNENGEFTFIATDLAGNETRETVTITNIFKTKRLSTTITGIGGILKAFAGLVELSADTEFSIGSNLVFKAEPEPLYCVYKWTVNGVETISRNLEYQLNNVNTDTVVSVEFGLHGDLNLDDTMTLTDLVKLRRNLAGLESLENKAIFNADLNEDNTLSLTDLVKLRRSLAGLN